MKIRPVRRSRNASPCLPLFSWADARDRWRDAPYPARAIARRHGLLPCRAILVSELAGLRGRTPAEVLDRTPPVDLFRIGTMLDDTLVHRHPPRDDDDPDESPDFFDPALDPESGDA